MNIRHVGIDVLGFGKVPTYGTKYSAGADLYASNIHDIIIPAGQSATIPLSIRVELPEDAEMQIRPRSGMSFKYNIDAVLGTVDSDYRGEVAVRLRNFSNEDYVVKRGDRIAQAVFNGYEGLFQANFVARKIEDKKADRVGGFGSTGK